MTPPDHGLTRRRVVELFRHAVTLENIHFRACQQTFLEASSLYWSRRAATFEAVGTPKCDEIAEACRNHARLMSGEFGDVEPWPGFTADLDMVLAERGLA